MAEVPESPLISLVVVSPLDQVVGARSDLENAAVALSDKWEVLIVTAGERAPLQNSRMRHVSFAGTTLAEAMSEGAKQAAGDYIVFVSEEDVPDPETAVQILREVAERANADVVYFDGAALDGSPAFVKPAFSPERLRSQDYWGTFVAYRRSLVSAIGAGREQTRGAELYDLALRASRATRSISQSRLQLAGVSGSIEASWYPDASTRSEAIKRALEEHLSETGGGDVLAVDTRGIHRTQRVVHGSPLVSVVIPTGGTSAQVRGKKRVMVLEAVREIARVSTYTNLEFVFVVDSTTPDDVRNGLAAIVGDRAQFVEWGEAFSFSGKMNLGVLHARGEFVLLLNDDVEVITPTWIESLLSLAQLPRAGTVGSMLFFEDDTIQHAGQAYYKLDVTHIGFHSERGATGPNGAFLVDREVAGNTAACLMMRREVFFEVGGFSTLLPGNFNDVDLCMKVAALGYQSYWTPKAELYHFESKSRDPRVGVSEIRTAWERWEHLFYDSELWPIDPHEVYSRDALSG